MLFKKLLALYKQAQEVKKANKAYQELLELGVTNSQVQIGDIMGLLRDVKFGEGMLNTDNFLRPMLSKLKKRTKVFSRFVCSRG